MNSASLSTDELLAWNDTTAKRWMDLLSAHPDFLDIPCDIYKPGTVRQLFQHIVATELRYAERLADSAVTDYAAISCATPAEIFATHTRAFARFRELLAQPSFDWSKEIVFNTLTAGRRSASRRAVLHHALLHGVRHYAQLATLARQHGISPGPMDYLITASRTIA